MIESISDKLIVIEGTGGAGKTTAAGMLAQRYNLSNFNTGTLFRASAAAMLYDQMSLDEAGDFVRESSFKVEHGLNSLQVAVNGRDVSELLQFPEVTGVASQIGQVSTVATRLEAIFDQNLLHGRNMVIEGKHLAERLGKTATHMFFFDARLQVRAQRKWQQAHQLNTKAEYTIHEALIDTYINDHRDKGLLIVPPGTAFEMIDTSDLTPLQVVQRMAKEANLG